MKEENDRQYDIIDQMLSMHALLRDSYNRRALLLNIGLLVASVFLCALVFANDQILAYSGLNPKSTKILLGFASVSCFTFSLIEYRVDWQGKSALHSDAVSKLSALKADYRGSYSKFRGENAEENDKLSRKYAETMDNIIDIPESQFAKLKAKHLFKKLLSKRISDYPATPAFLLRIQLMFHGFRKAFLNEKKHGNK